APKLVETKADLPVMFPGTLKGGDADLGTRRVVENIQTISVFMADIDDGTPLEDLRNRLREHDAIVYSSYSHTDAHPRWRVSLLLSRDFVIADYGAVAPDVWRYVWARAVAKLGLNADRKCSDLTRAYFLPSHGSQ